MSTLQPKQHPTYLTPAELSQRYGARVSERTLANWRYLGTGPKFTRVVGRVLYPLSELEAWESKRTVESTSNYKK